jgi:hypothetical protein
MVGLPTRQTWRVFFHYASGFNVLVFLRNSEVIFQKTSIILQNYLSILQNSVAILHKKVQNGALPDFT